MLRIDSAALSTGQEKLLPLASGGGRNVVFNILFPIYMFLQIC